MLRWSVKTSFSASTLSSLKPVVESMFPGKNKLFSKTSYWHSICNFTCANTWPIFTNQGGFRWPWTNRYRRGGPLWFIYLVLMLFDAQDGSQSSSSLSSTSSGPNRNISAALPPRAGQDIFVQIITGLLKIIMVDSPDDHWERGCCKQLCKRPLYHWEGANRGEYFHMFIFAYLHIYIFSYFHIFIF